MAREARDAGVWLFSAGLESQRASVVSTDGTVTDGPFPETKELVGGYWLIKAASLVDALGWIRRCPQLPGGGDLEIRQVSEATDFI